MIKNFQNEEMFDPSDKILALDDHLSEEIIMANIREQLDSQLKLYTERKNYLTLFKEKYAEITPENSFFDKNYLQDSLEKVTELVKTSFAKKYRITIGKELDFYFPSEYLSDMESIYEFFFIRHFDNLADYFFSELKRNRSQFVERYSKLLQSDEHNKDIFVQQMKKKFKHNADIAIVHFIDNIIEDIKDANKSAFMLFDTLLNMDPLEETNNKVRGLLNNYGNGLNFERDVFCYDLYMKPLEVKEIKNELRNSVLMRYIKTTETEE